MRNFSHKTYTKPNTQNSFRRDQRNYPQQKKLIKKQKATGKKQILNSLSKQPEQTKLDLQNIPSSFQPVMLQIPSKSKQNNTQRYYLTLQQSFPYTDRNSTIQINDLYCMWYHKLEPTHSSLKRKLKISQVTYVISDWAQDQFPLVLFLTIDGIFGYLDNKAIPTSRIVALKLVKQNVIEKSSITCYDLIYQSSAEIEWEIPQTLTHLRLGLMDQNSNPIMLPLPDPLTVQIEITSYK